MNCIKEASKIKGLFPENVLVLDFQIPEGQTEEELSNMVRREIRNLVKTGVLEAQTVYVYGRLTLGMSVALGYELCRANVNKIEMSDRKTNLHLVVGGKEL